MRNKGITLIALVVTIIVLVILAGVSINLLFGQYGIVTRANQAQEVSLEQKAKEKLELELGNLLIEKQINVNYNDEFFDNYLTQKGFIVNANIVIVDGWQFQVDKSVPKIEISLGKGKESNQIEINSNIEYSSDFLKSTINITINSENELNSIILNSESLEIPNHENGIYSITKEVNSNGIYNIYVRNINGEYKVKNITVSGIIQDTQIGTLDDLLAFASRVNQGATYEGKTITLLKNLDLTKVCYKTDGTVENDVSWTPIGTSSNPFKGTLNGNGKTITGIYVNNGQENQGLFGVTENATVKNLSLNGQIGTTGKAYVGMLSGQFKSGTIENVVVKNDAVIQGGDYTGGLVGKSTAIITNVENYGTVISNGTYVGGICGNNDGGTVTGAKNYGSVTGELRVGGIVGNGGTVTNCANENLATIIGNRGHVGGIAGYDTNVSYCYNKGNIKGNGDDGTGFTSVGGIIGTHGKIRHCYNRGNVYGAKGQAAGIKGNGYNNGTDHIMYCYNTGVITGEGRAIGSIVGENNVSTINYCFYTSSNDICGYRGEAHNSSKVTDDELKAAGFANTYLNDTNWIDDGKKIDKFGNVVDNLDKSGNVIYINDGYPIFKWEVTQ